MSIQVKLDLDGKVPIYKQLLEQFEGAIRSGILIPGEQVPSINDFAKQLDISKETVKKAYGILSEKGLLVPQQGKGFYVAEPSESTKPRVLVLFDKLSVIKEELFNSLSSALGDEAEITILLHSQNVEIFAYYLDTCLDKYDYYVVSPHFPLDDKTQAAVRKLLARIPNRKLIMIDHWLQSYNGNYGAVYQDYENDIYEGLKQGLEKLRTTSRLRVIILPSSLYGARISRGVERFCIEYGIPYEFMNSAPDEISPNETFLVLNAQLDSGLASLAKKIRAKGLEAGKDVFIISYNEYELNEVVLNGLTTVSADFRQMGRTAAMMILNRKIWKAHCDFNMIRRSTF